MVVGDILRNSATRSPDRIALIGRGQRLTYAEFERCANRLANALIALDLDKGAKVAILSSNRPEYAIAYFAIARTPYVSAHCSTRSIATELVYVLNRIEADVLILESAFVDFVKSILPDLERTPSLLVLDRGADPDGVTSIDDFVSEFPDDPPETALRSTA